MSNSRNLGFTLPELLITMGILSILFGLVTINLLHLQHNSSLNATLDTLVSDLRSQQNKAMTLDTEGRATADNYGIHFETSKYSLFHGSSYSSSDTTNFDVKLDPSLQFSNITVPSSSIIFSKGTGEVSGVGPGSDTVVLKDTSNNEQKTIQSNVYGVITVQ